MGWLDQLRQAGLDRREVVTERVIVEPPKRKRLEVVETYVQTRPQSGNDPGEIRPIWYTLDEQRLLTLTDRDGVPVKDKGGATLVRVVAPEEQPITIAKVLANKLRRETETPFNRPLRYKRASLV